jgi:hypothetical protein
VRARDLFVDAAGRAIEPLAGVAPGVRFERHPEPFAGVVDRALDVEEKVRRGAPRPRGRPLGDPLGAVGEAQEEG